MLANRTRVPVRQLRPGRIEWKVWQDVELPDDKMLIPGVVGHATDFIEPPNSSPSGWSHTRIWLVASASGVARIAGWVHASDIRR